MSRALFLLKNNSRNLAVLRIASSPAFLLGLILVLGIALRFYDLGTESYWIDEMSTVMEGQQSIHQLITSGRLDQPPGYYLPFHLWIQIFGTAEVSTRSFSVLAGTGSLILIYLIGRELFGEGIGLVSAFMMAISEFQIYYSQNARYYSFFELTALLSFLFFIIALKTKGKMHFVLYCVSSMVMVYSHAYGIFILAAQNLVFILQVKGYRDLLAPWLICQVLIMLAFLPYFYPLVSGNGGIQGAATLNSGGTPAVSLLEPLRSVYRYIMPGRRGRSWEVIIATYAVAGIFFAIGAGIYAPRQGKSYSLAAARTSFYSPEGMPNVTSKLLLLSCWLLLPVLIPFILSIVITPMYTDRYTIGAAPALYLLLALGIFNIRKVVPVINTLAVLVIMIVPGLHHYYRTDVNEQWNEVAQYIEANAETNDVIVFAPNMGIGIQQKSFDWYYRGSLQECGIANQLKEPAAISRALNQCVDGHSRFWVIIPNYASDPFVPHYRSFFLGAHQNILRKIHERQFVLISVYLIEITKQ